ncbi:MAG: heavy-metal-associated domain-containing protein [Acholeplasmataceae bacterium]|nr:heavy-metal-associated domain-containing protein [Acholeplasmataceae bacterium]
MKKTVLQLETLTCPSCIRRIEGTLIKLEGIETAVVKFNASKVEVVYDEKKQSDESVLKVVKDLGYKVISSK